jgi:hypothetical protein
MQTLLHNIKSRRYLTITFQGNKKLKMFILFALKKNFLKFLKKTLDLVLGFCYIK